MEATQTWFDVIPALPLARGVPMVHIGTQRRGVPKMITDDEALGVAWWAGKQRGYQYAQANLRIDLDDPQGFGYALRLYTMKRIEAPLNGARLAHEHPSKAGESMLERWVLGTTTDADRLALALALREVFGG